MPDDQLSLVCGKCGAKIRYPARFAGKDARCKSCGSTLALPEDPFVSDIVDDLPPVTSHRISIPAPEEAGFNPVAWAEKRVIAPQAAHTKSRIGAALLAFFLGPLGFHRFYLNQTGMGLIILLLSITGCGLFMTIPLSLVDCLGFLMMTDEVFAEKYSPLTGVSLHTP
jgi:TM2 domain-containing membrane protein YozV/DNA-directed RNA polymerase subunit RPC12/RpoP